ncbi:MAG: RES family NAD+ phosphorylase [Cyclobacteriaceae bacterium]
MIVYRICKTYPPEHNPIDGMGAFQRGGRWNSKGTAAVYTASSLALARAELSRHMNLETIPDDYRVYEIAIPDEKYPLIDPLPPNWDSDPIDYLSKESGDNLLNNTNLLGFQVPSVCDRNSFNYILNPNSKHYKKVKVKRSYAFVA